MIVQQRAITPEEVEVILVTLRVAPTRVVDPAVLESVASRRVVGHCECGCASVDFAAAERREGGPLGDAMGTTPTGGEVGVLVWSSATEITALEIYDLGAGEGDLRLPVPGSIRRWARG